MGKTKQLEFLEQSSREGRTAQQARPKPCSSLSAVLIRALLSAFTQRLPEVRSYLKGLKEMVLGACNGPGIVSLPTSQTCKNTKEGRKEEKEHTKIANRKQIMR